MAETIAEKNIILNLITKSEGANKALSDLDKVQSKSNGLKGVVGGLGKSFALAFAAFKAGEVIKQMADLAVEIDKVSGNSKGLADQQDGIKDSLRRVAVLASQTLIPLLDKVFKFVQPIIRAFAVEIPAAIKAAIPTVQSFVNKGLAFVAEGLGTITGNATLKGYAAAAKVLQQEAEKDGRNYSERYAEEIEKNEKAWKEAGKVVGKIFGEGLSREQQKAIEKLKKDILKAARNIEDLQAVLISDNLKRRTTELNLVAQRQIEALVGTPEQIEEQTKLINQVLNKQIEKLIVDANTKIEKLATPLSQVLRQSLQNVPQDQLDDQFKVSLGIDQDDRFFNEAKDSLDQLFNGAKEQADNITLFDKIEQFIDEAQLEEVGEKIFDSFKALSDDILQLNIDRVDDDIKIQESRIQRLQELESGATEEQLRLENERLTELEEKRRQFAERQRGIAAIQIAANSAVAVSEGISAVIAGFSSGNLFTGIAQAIALAGTIASTVFAVKQAVSSIPAFRTGETDFQPNSIFSDGDSDSGIARLHRGEGVSPASINQKLNRLGVPVTDPNLPKLVEIGIGASKTPIYTPMSFDSPVSSKDIKEMTGRLSGKLDHVIRAYEALDINFNVNSNGISASMKKSIRKRRRMAQKLK